MFGGVVLENTWRCENDAVEEGSRGEGLRGTKEKMQEIFFFFFFTSRPAMEESRLFFFPFLGSPPELRGGLVRTVDGGKRAES